MAFVTRCESEEVRDCSRTRWLMWPTDCTQGPSSPSLWVSRKDSMKGNMNGYIITQLLKNKSFCQRSKYKHAKGLFPVIVSLHTCHHFNITVIFYEQHCPFIAHKTIFKEGILEFGSLFAFSGVSLGEIKGQNGQLRPGRMLRHIICPLNTVIPDSVCLFFTFFKEGGREGEPSILVIPWQVQARDSNKSVTPDRQ